MAIKFSRKQKAVLWLGVLLCLWQAYNNDQILSWAFLFLTAGAIPGTDTRLSPDTVLTILPFVFVAIVLLIFRKELMRGLRTLKRSFKQGERAVSVRATVSAPGLVTARQSQLEPVVAAEAAAPDTLVVPVVPAATLIPERRRDRRSVHPAKCRLQLTLIPLKKALHRFDVWLAPHLQKAAYGLGYGWQWLVTYVVLACRAARAALRFAGRVVRVETRNLWRIISPQLWKFDHWLGVQLHKVWRSRRMRHYRHIGRELKRSVLVHVDRLRR